MNNGYKKIVIEKLIAVGTEQAKDRLGNFNSLRAICLKKGLTPEEYMQVYEGVLRNVMKNCDSLLKNTLSIKERYENEIKKVSVGGPLMHERNKSDTNSF